MTKQANLYSQVSEGQFQAGLALIEMLKPQPGHKILDVGAGTGNLTFELAKKVQPDGYVIAIEPDSERIDLAQLDQPKGIDNIRWVNHTLANLGHAFQSEFDGAFSNYVFHWIENQKQAILQVYEALKPGACFGFCCVFDMPDVVRKLCHAVPKGQAIIDSLHFSSKAQWLEHFEDAGFEILQLKDVPDYVFKSVDDVMVWWEATTHGNFAISQLSKAQLEQFQHDYPGEIKIYKEETIRLIAKK